ncbi:SPRY domain-containing SOCS box protein 3-like isoform X2 [Denticeps clupeoides]|uniref:SPRY domain-containing SOCS box protein 3 n=1 Tax=Denticeps clupeoides TaxID=299321 RepID=A0AAY4EJZ9_9TELE|nr:SPRY domain-containing SOCS box protein 3-like isoform X2 [Denticeps clupeoides]
MSRRARPDHAQRCIWSGITRETEITPLMMTYESDEWRVQGSEDSESDSDSEYQDVSLPVATVMPLVVPVTGESFCQCPVQAEVTYDPSLGLLPHDCLCGEDEIGCDWVWDESCKSSAAFLSCSNKKVSFHTEYSCGTAAIRGSKELSDGQHFWEIKMTSPVYGTDMMVGIGTSAVNVDQFKHNFCSLLGADGDSWGLSYTGLLHHKGSKVSFSPRFGQGSIIGVHLDSWHGTLTFYKNRRCIGVAARQLQNKRLYPMVCSTAAKSSMKVIRSCSVPTSLLYLCSLRLRQLLPDCTDVLTALALPPGLRMLLHVRLGWVLSLDSTAEAVETPTTDTDDDSDSDGSASDPETCQRKRCRWT